MPNSFPATSLGDQKENIDAEEMWTMDADKYDAEMGAVVVEEGGGGVGVAAGKKGAGGVEGVEGAEEDGYASEEAKEYAEWDGYEQEV